MSSEVATPESLPLSQIREGELNVISLKGGKKAIAIRTGREVRVFRDICPHMGADLAEARYCAKTGTIHCRWHGYVFSANDGRFLENPNEKLMHQLRMPSAYFKPEKMPRYRLTILPVTVKEGRVIVGRDSDLDEAPRGES